MRKIEVKTVQTKEVYVALDGTQFDNLSSCINYECQYYEDRYEEIPHVRFYQSDILEDAPDYIGYDIICVRNSTDVNIINNYIITQGGEDYSELLTEDDIGKKIFIYRDEFKVYYISNYSMEDFATSIISNLNYYNEQVRKTLK